MALWDKSISASRAKWACESHNIYIALGTKSVTFVSHLPQQVTYSFSPTCVGCDAFTLDATTGWIKAIGPYSPDITPSYFLVVVASDNTRTGTSITLKYNVKSST